MSAPAELFVVGAANYVDTEACSEGSQCGVSTAERCSHDAYGEECHHCHAKLPCCREHRQQFVAVCGQAHATAGCKVYKQYAQGKEQHICREEGKTLFWASNFSLGVAIFSAVNKYLAKIMNGFPNYDVSMVETHHVHKLDAPSGTAITLAEGILENLERKSKWVMGTLTAPDGTVTGTARCAPDELPISAIREGEVPGIHTVRYESEADSIIITHDAKNRKGFALGAVLAAEYTALHTGFLGMNDLFHF